MTLARSQGSLKATMKLKFLVAQCPLRKPSCGLRVKVPWGITNEKCPVGVRYNSAARAANSVERSRPEAPSPPVSNARSFASALYLACIEGVIFEYRSHGGLPTRTSTRWSCSASHSGRIKFRT